MSQIAAYLRVSTDDQTAENQRLEIERWREYQEIPEESIDYYVEEGVSGADDNRPIMEQLLEQIRLGKYRQIVVVAFDRWYRSAGSFILLWNELEDLDVQLLSLREPQPQDGPFKGFMAKLFALLGELELGIISERTRGGMARRKSQGGHVSRPYFFLQWSSSSLKWIVYRHEPRDPQIKGGRWRNRRLDFWDRPGDMLELQDFKENRDRKGERFGAGAGTISRLQKCVDAADDPRPGDRIRWGRPIGGGSEGVLFFVDGRWRPIGDPIGLTD